MSFTSNIAGNLANFEANQSVSMRLYNKTRKNNRSEKKTYWELVGIGALFVILGVAELYLFLRQNIHGKVDWDNEAVEDTVEELSYTGPVGVFLLVFGILLVALGFLY